MLEPFQFVSNRIFNVPLAVTSDKAIAIINGIGPRIIGETFSPFPAATTTSKEAAKPSVDFSLPKHMGIVPVYNTLVSKASAGESGTTSYGFLTSKIKDLLASGKTTIGFDITSPGGEVTGLFALTDLIKSLQSKGIKTFAYADMAASAAYAIAASTGQIFAAPSSTLGSIGVIAALRDETRADTKAGVSYTILRSKSEKAIYNPKEPKNSAALNHVKTMIMQMDKLFDEKVQLYRPNVTGEILSSLNGREVLLVEAMSNHLADVQVNNMEEAIDRMSKKSSVSMAGSSKLNQTKGKTPMDLQETQDALTQASAENIQLKAEILTLKGQLDSAKAVGITEERTRISGLFEAATKLRADTATLQKAIAKGYTLEIANDLFEANAQATGAATSVNVAGNLDSTIGLRSAIAAVASETPSMSQALQSNDFWARVQGMEANPFANSQVR